MQKQPYRVEIDGLRAVAVLLVVLYHYGLGMSGGFIGVDVFFVISGFLITGNIRHDLENRQFSLREFWAKRARRILPAAMLMLLTCVGIGWMLLAPYDFQKLGEAILAQSVFASNIYFWQESGYFAAPSEMKPLLHMWSLAVEEQFYFYLPLLMFAITKWTNFTLSKVLSTVFVLSFAANALGVSMYPDATFYLLPTRAWELLIGSLLAFKVDYNFDIQKRCTNEALGWAGLVAIIAAAMLFDHSTVFPGWNALLPCLGTAAILYATRQESSFLQRTLSNRGLVFVGLVSYSWYLWHWPLLVFAKYYLAEQLGLFPRCSLLVASFMIAVLSWRYVEIPFRQKRFLAEQPRLLRYSLVTTSVMALLGFALTFTEGVPSRYSAELQQYASGRTDHNPRREKTHNLSVARLLEQGIPSIWQGSATTKPELLVWGDSHCDAVMPVIRKFCRENGITAHGASQNMTLPLLEIYKDSQVVSPDYFLDFNRAMFAFAKQHQIKHVLLVARWSEHLKVNNSDSSSLTGDLRIVGSNQHSSSGQAFEIALTRTVKQFHAIGVQVWLMQQVPTQESVVPNALMQAVTRGEDPLQLGVLLQQHRKDVRQVDSMFAELSAGKVQLLDPVPLFCNEKGICLVGKGGQALYCDTNHLTVTGAMELWPMFQPLVNAILQQRADYSVAHK